METSRQAAKNKAAEKNTPPENLNVPGNDLPEDFAEGQNVDKETGEITERNEVGPVDQGLGHIFDDLKNARKNKALVEQTGEYLRFEDWKDGEERNFILVGFATMPNEDGDLIPVVNLIDEDGNGFIAGSDLLMKACLRLKEKGLPQGIVVRKDAPKPGKRYHNIKVYSFA